MIRLNVNGKRHEVDADPETPLLWVLRDRLGLTGTKYSCGIGECGACTVLVDGEAELSCSMPLKEAAGRSVTTIEGIEGLVGRALKQAWVEEDVPQCGFCQPGQVMTAAALLMKNPGPTDREVEAAMSGVLCRCGSYEEIRKAVRRASEEVRHGRG
ncbi:MAG: (2Fe-2S)-binding protein [Proteobacteria bacterium]|nr:(2Fe-2S)-binding protein [Pseudomonadota bacterium]